MCPLGTAGSNPALSVKPQLARYRLAWGFSLRFTDLIRRDEDPHGYRRQTSRGFDTEGTAKRIGALSIKNSDVVTKNTKLTEARKRARLAG